MKHVFVLIVSVSWVWGCASGLCPSGTEMKGAAPPEGTEFSCRKEVDGRKVSHGPFAKWYDPKTKKAEGAYQEGERHGTFKRWNEQGQLLASESYVTGLKDGVAQYFRDDGTPTRERSYTKDVLNGPSKTWDAEGSLTEEGSYAEGKKHGTWTVWVSRDPKELKQLIEYEGGQIKGEIRLVDGSGADMDPSELGGGGGTGPVEIKSGNKVIYAGNMVLGLREGEWTSWHDEEQKAATYTYRGGLRDGEFEVYGESGDLLRKGTYIGGKLDSHEQRDANPVVKFSETLFEIPEADGVLKWGPIWVKDTVFIVTDSGVVHGIVRKSRNKDWRWKSASPVVEAPEVVYAGGKSVLRLVCEDGKVRWVDVKKGEQLQEFALPTTPTPPDKPRKDTFRVVDGTKIGSVSKGFEELWWLHDAGAKIAAHIPWKIPGSNYTSDGVAFGTDAGKLIILDAKSGEVAFEHDVGMPVVDLAVAYKHLVVFVKSPEGYRYQLWKEPAADGVVSTSEPVAAAPLVRIGTRKTSATFTLGDSYFATDTDDKPVKGSDLKLKGPVAAVMDRALFAGGDEPEVVGPSWYSIIKERHERAVHWRHPWPESMRCKQPENVRLTGDPSDWFFGCVGERTVWWLFASQVKEPKPKAVWRYTTKPTVDLEEVEGILVGSTYDAVFAVDSLTGRGLWKEYTNEKTTFRVFGANVVGAAAGDISAWNLVTGEELWKNRLSGKKSYHSMVTPSGALRMYGLASGGVAVDMVDARLGVTRWTYKDLKLCSGGYPWGVVGKALMVCSGDVVVGVSLEGGDLLFERPLESGPTFTPGAVIDVDKTQVVAIGEDGEVLWKSEEIPMEVVEGPMTLDENEKLLKVTGANYTDDGEHVEEEKDFYLDLATGKRAAEDAFQEPIYTQLKLYGKDYTFSWLNDTVAVTWGGRDRYTQGLIAYDYRFDPKFVEKRDDLAKALGVSLPAQ